MTFNARFSIQTNSHTHTHALTACGEYHKLAYFENRQSRNKELFADGVRCAMGTES